MRKGYKDLLAEANTVIETYPVETAVAHLNDEEIVFVDLRDTPELVRDGKIQGAVHVPRGLLEFLVDPESPNHNLIFSSGKKLLFYSTGGKRSAFAAQRVQEMGLTQVAHIGGGIKAWKEAGGPVERVNREYYEKEVHFENHQD